MSAFDRDPTVCTVKSCINPPIFISTTAIANDGKHGYCMEHKIFVKSEQALFRNIEFEDVRLR